jgi:hypothetical protein
MRGFGSGKRRCIWPAEALKHMRNSPALDGTVLYGAVLRLARALQYSPVEHRQAVTGSGDQGRRVRVCVLGGV